MAPVPQPRRRPRVRGWRWLISKGTALPLSTTEISVLNAALGPDAHLERMRQEIMARRGHAPSTIDLRRIASGLRHFLLTGETPVEPDHVTDWRARQKLPGLLLRPHQPDDGDNWFSDWLAPVPSLLGRRADADLHASGLAAKPGEAA